MSGSVRMPCDSLLTKKSVAVCQQTCCKLIVKSCYQQACCKLFQQVVTSLQITGCNKPDFNRLCNLMKLTSLLQLVDKLQQVGKIDNIQQVCDVLAVQCDSHNLSKLIFCYYYGCKPNGKRVMKMYQVFWLNRFALSLWECLDEADATEGLCMWSHLAGTELQLK